MKIKFFLHGPALVEWTVPDPTTFNFMFMCKAIRSDGYFIANDIYIPHSEIQAIGISEGLVVQYPQPTAPSTETKQ